MDDNKRVAKAAKALPLLMLAGFVIVAAGMKAAGAILVPFFMAVFIAIVCTPRWEV